MVRKRARVLWEHVRSPITARALLLFLAVVFVGYTIWRDTRERMDNRAAYQRLDAMAARQIGFQQDTERITNAVESNAKLVNAQLEVLKQMADALKSDKAARAAEHDEIARQLALGRAALAKPKTKPKRKGTPKPPEPQCWRIVVTTEKVGDNQIVKRDLVQVPCPK